MLTIETFLRSEGRFVPVQDFSGTILDPDYIEGALVISQNGIELIGLKHWDYIDQLWGYIADGVVEIAAGKNYDCHFPDQPIALSLKSLSRGAVEIEVDIDGGRRLIVERSVFLSVFSMAATDFFLSMKKLVPDSSQSWDLYLERLISVSRS